jgi:hypothetical protein
VWGSGLIREETAVSESTTEAAEAMIDPVTGVIIDQKELAERLLAQAKEQGVSLVGPGGLLNQLTKTVLTSDRTGADRGAAGPGGILRAGDRAQAQTAPGWDRSDRALPLGSGSDDRGDRRALRGGLRGHGFQGHHLEDHFRRSPGSWPSGRPGRWIRSTR